MTELLTSARMRAVEQAAIASGSVTGRELMARAGGGVFDAILDEWPDLALSSHRAVVLCGPGNNGGDGFVIARLLHERGWELDVFLLGAPPALPPDARDSHDRWSALGPVIPIDLPAPGSAGLGRLRATMEQPDRPPAIVIDALFGTGLTRPADSLAPLFALTHRGARGAMRVVSVDVPSGLCADSGRILGPEPEPGAGPSAMLADLTVTFHRPKTGHYLAAGPAACGRLRVADIGLPPGDGLSATAPCLTAPSITRLGKRGRAHKYHHGHAVILSGPSPKGGAARLAARGALRVGAGLVTVAAPPDAIRDHAAQLTAVMLRAVGDAGALAEMLSDPRLNALCLGPGLGTGPETRALVAAALNPPRTVVLDADALSAFEEAPDLLFDQLHAGCVLTPHDGEFARLFPDLAARLAEPATRGPAFSKLDATREAASRAGCTVLLKGPDTAIADQTGAARINAAVYERAAPWLATAGAGDVLAGMITGLLARGLPPLDAAADAAWLHVEAALEFGPGLIAEDLPEALPAVFRRLGL